MATTSIIFVVAGLLLTAGAVWWFLRQRKLNVGFRYLKMSDISAVDTKNIDLRDDDIVFALNEMATIQTDAITSKNTCSVVGALGTDVNQVAIKCSNYANFKFRSRYEISENIGIKFTIQSVNMLVVFNTKGTANLMAAIVADTGETEPNIFICQKTDPYIEYDGDLQVAAGINELLSGGGVIVEKKTITSLGSNIMHTPCSNTTERIYHKSRSLKIQDLNVQLRQLPKITHEKIAKLKEFRNYWSSQITANPSAINNLTRIDTLLAEAEEKKANLVQKLNSIFSATPKTRVERQSWVKNTASQVEDLTTTLGGEEATTFKKRWKQTVEDSKPKQPALELKNPATEPEKTISKRESSYQVSASVCEHDLLQSPQDPETVEQWLRENARCAHQLRATDPENAALQNYQRINTEFLALRRPKRSLEESASPSSEYKNWRKETSEFQDVSPTLSEILNADDMITN